MLKFYITEVLSLVFYVYATSKTPVPVLLVIVRLVYLEPFVGSFVTISRQFVTNECNKKRVHFNKNICFFKKMEGFDDPGVFFSDNFSEVDNQNDAQINLQGVKKKFKEFIRQYHTDNFNYKYRYVYHSVLSEIFH